jgi:DinB family protein
MEELRKADARYPIGKFDRSKAPTSAEERKRLIDRIAELPERLHSAVAGLNGKQLDTPYREGGWMVRQVVHHLADAHINAYTRFKLALTEQEPPVKPFDEAAWAELPDSRFTPIDVSLALVDSLHARWVVLLRSLKPEDWERKLKHPEAGFMSLNLMLGIYAWHGEHHVAQINALRARNQW